MQNFQKLLRVTDTKVCVMLGHQGTFSTDQFLSV